MKLFFSLPNGIKVRRTQLLGEIQGMNGENLLIFSSSVYSDFFGHYL